MSATKQKYRFLLVPIICVCIFATCFMCGCNQSAQNANDQTKDYQYVDEQEWKAGYLTYIDNLEMTWKEIGRYSLINIGNGNVPALYIGGNSMAMGGKLAYYYKGEVKELSISEIVFEYIEGENKIKNSGGHMGSYFDLVYTFKDGDFQTIFNGRYKDTTDTQNKVNPDGTLKYDYTINDNPISKEKYLEQLNENYNANKSTRIEYRAGIICGEMQKQLRG